jgi:hypothetical protein
MAVILASVPYPPVSRSITESAISPLRCSRAWCSPSMRTSASPSSIATLSLILTTGISRPSNDVPMLPTRTIPGCAWATAWILHRIWSYPWYPASAGGYSSGAGQLGEPDGMVAAAPEAATAGAVPGADTKTAASAVTEANTLRGTCR